MQYLDENIDAYRAGIKSVYTDAVAFALESAFIDTGQSRAYWAAWFATRRTATAFLREAKDLNLTAEQQAKFLSLAQVIAYD